MVSKIEQRYLTYRQVATLLGVACQLFIVYADQGGLHQRCGQSAWSVLMSMKF